MFILTKEGPSRAEGSQNTSTAESPSVVRNYMKKSVIKDISIESSNGVIEKIAAEL